MSYSQDIVWNAITDSAKTRFDYSSFERLFAGFDNDTGDSRLLKRYRGQSPINAEWVRCCTLADQAVVSFRGLPGGSARRRRPTSFSNLLIVLSPASGLPVCVARRRALMSLESSACRRKTFHASGDGLNPVALIKSLGKLSKVAWPTCTAALDQVYFQAKVAMDARTGFRST